MCGRLYLSVPTQELLLIVWQLFYKSKKEGHCNKIDNSSIIFMLYWLGKKPILSIPPHEITSKDSPPFQKLLIYLRMKCFRIFNTTLPPDLIPYAVRHFRCIYQVSFFSLWRVAVTSCFSWCLSPIVRI